MFGYIFFFVLSVFSEFVQGLSSFEASALQGRWYQMHSSLVAKETFQADTFCNTVDYYNYYDSGSSVFFSAAHMQNIGSPQGAIKQTGLMLYNKYQERHSDRFKIVYTDALLKVEASLWVRAFGEPEGNSTVYPWVFLSSPNGIYSYILAREPKTFQNKYQKGVMKIVNAIGFTNELTRPIPTYHSDLCHYAPTQAVD